MLLWCGWCNLQGQGTSWLFLILYVYLSLNITSHFINIFSIILIYIIYHASPYIHFRPWRNSIGGYLNSYHFPKINWFRMNYVHLSIKLKSYFIIFFWTYLTSYSTLLRIAIFDNDVIRPFNTVSPIIFQKSSDSEFLTSLYQ